VVVSFGVNDTTVEGGVPRIDPGESAANLQSVVDGVRAAGHRVLVVGPPPVADDRQNARIGALSRRFGEVCSRTGTVYVPVFDALVADAVWRAEAAAIDGAHPGAAGYARLAALVLPASQAWMGLWDAR